MKLPKVVSDTRWFIIRGLFSLLYVPDLTYTDMIDGCAWNQKQVCWKALIRVTFMSNTSMSNFLWNWDWSFCVLCSKYVRRKCLISGLMEQSVFFVCVFWHKIICCCCFLPSVEEKRNHLQFSCNCFFHLWLSVKQWDCVISAWGCDMFSRAQTDISHLKLFLRNTFLK